MIRRMILTLVLVLSLCIPAFALITNDHDTTNNYYDQSTTNQGGAGGAGGSAVVNDNSKTYNTNTNLNTNVNTNKIDNKNTNIQGQQQGQIQGQVNDQVIAPSQSVVIQNPRTLLSAPGVNGVELNYFSGGQRDVTGVFPKFATGDIRPISSKDVLYRVFSVTANVKFKSLYETAIKDMTKAINDKWPTERLRYQIMEVDAQKSWNTGGNIGSAGSAFTGPTSGASASAGLIPSVGGVKVANLYTIVIVIVKY